MTRIMVVVGSVRPGRVGLPVAQWVRGVAEAGGADVDFVDLAELALPLMDEPNHPRAQNYTKPATIAWSERVKAADAFVFVTPEYNHSFSPALKNAIDYLSQEWWRKPVGIVSYGGVSAGTRGVVALTPVLAMLGMVRAGSALEIPFIGTRIADGVFTGTDRETAIAENLVAELGLLAGALAPLQLHE